MKINQIIREKRKALSLTQEQAAEYLGVSASAVYKWEKGISYPDVTLLPPLARLLRTDLNTLLCFFEELTDGEIRAFVEEVDRTVREQGYEAAYRMAMDKIREYPTCDSLICSVVLYLEGALFLYGVPGAEGYRASLHAYYERLASSETPEIRETALNMLISDSLEQKDFSRAEALISALPAATVDRQERLAALYMRQERYEEAEKLWERRVLNGVTELQTALMNLLDIACKEGREGDADFYAQRCEGLAELFCFPQWMACTARFQLSVARQDQEVCLAVLRKMLPSLRERWRPQDCPLYRSLDGGETSALSRRLLETIANEMGQEGELAFLQGCAGFEDLRRELEALTGR